MESKFPANAEVHVDTQDSQWGRVASDGVVLGESKRRVFVNVFSIRANIWVPKQDVRLLEGPKWRVEL